MNVMYYEEYHLERNLIRSSLNVRHFSPKSRLVYKVFIIVDLLRQFQKRFNQ